VHEHEFGNQCQVRDCTETSVYPTKACAAHQSAWNKYQLDHSAARLAGSKRMLNCQQKNREWNPKPEQEFQPHDQPAPEPKKLKHFFGPATFPVLKQFVVHVVLLRHGQNLPEQSQGQTFWPL
jgi:hypothetical protein